MNMKKEKTYRAQTWLVISVRTSSGAKRIRFTPEGDLSFYTTDNPDLQQAIERHRDFGQTIVMVSEHCSVEQTDVLGDSVLHLADQDELVGGVGTGRLSGTELERGERHERLIAQSGRTEGLHPHGDASLDEGMTLGDMRGTQVEGSRAHLAADVLTDETEDGLVVVKLVGADVNHRPACVGNDVVLGAGIHHGDIHPCGTQQRTLLLKTIVTQPRQVVEHGVNSVYTLTSGSMSRLPP